MIEACANVVRSPSERAVAPAGWRRAQGPSSGAHGSTTLHDTAKPHSDLDRIRVALLGAMQIASARGNAPSRIEYKSPGRQNPVTDLDQELDRFLRESLLHQDEGWLSEETADDLARLGKGRVWIVDPLDGTKELLAGIPEWCVSVGLAEEGKMIAGGIANPATGEIFLGGAGAGVTRNGEPVTPRAGPKPGEAIVLASRSEWKRGEWDGWAGAAFRIQPMGSVAYKLALVAAGAADATWTFVPKHEWDVAAGVALVDAAGGRAESLDGQPLVFNRRDVLFPGLLAFSAASRGRLAPIVRAACDSGKAGI